MKNTVFKQEEGFTLIELMAVLAILTMLVLIAVPAIGSITKKAEAQADDATISMIEKAGGLALLGDVAYDDPEEEQYEVATLVEEGYLDIDESHKYAGDGNTVTHIKGYEFEFESDTQPEPDAVDPSGIAAQITEANALLNDSSHYYAGTGNGNVYSSSNDWAWLKNNYNMELPTGEYTITMDVVSEFSTKKLHLALMTYDEQGQLLNTASGYAPSSIPFTITDDVASVKLRLGNLITYDSFGIVHTFGTTWVGNEVKLDVQPK